MGEGLKRNSGAAGQGATGIVGDRWHTRLARIQSELQEAGVHPAHAVVLLPYLQLVPLAARFWAAQFPNHFMPHFETTRTWAERVGFFAPDEADLSFDQGRDLLAAARLLEQTPLRAERDALAAALVAQATELSRVIGAVAPAHRADWVAAAARFMPTAGVASQKYEAVLARVALAWAGQSGYATDALFGSDVGRDLERLFVVRGLEPDALTEALLARFADCVVEWAPDPRAAGATTRLHPCADAADEAERAAACVLNHLAEGRAPVALVATDREVTRQISAMLASAGVQPGVHLRDETGWKLSTTHAAASVMAALRACAFDASSDDVLDWVKLTPAFAPAERRALEHWLRHETVRGWSRATQLPDAPALVAAIEALRAPMAAGRALARWLAATRTLLEACGLWAPLAADDAGSALIQALGLDDETLAQWQAWPAARRRMDFDAFMHWARATLEAATFKPPKPAEADVVVLPLSQLLDRPFAAAVIPGADEKRLPMTPEITGPWSDAQRQALGLPTRTVVRAVQQAAWAQVFASPAVDVLWSQSTARGEALQASPLVRLLDFDDALRPVDDAPEPRVARTVMAIPTLRPKPVASRLPMGALSATSYEMLRACPYRFFAKHLLGLGEDSELDQDVEKRDWGTWVHAVLYRFHQALRDRPDGDRLVLIEAAAEQATRERGLDRNPGEFLPFKAAWPALRDAYLEWQREREAEGFRFEVGELPIQTRRGELLLRGRIDRIDRDAAGQRVLIDYKTEAQDKTRGRLKAGSEDTQLPFYALLSGDETPRAAYLNLDDRKGPSWWEVNDLAGRAAALHEGMAHDVERIAQGATLRALGEGDVCEWCEVRGLCRKDFWS
ncbi:MAG: PD-(D/E)XK nuclease family protein [Burkholderiaceae bacterium]|nr:MAG: PD-(D/E)XK nuclease family protein [Burkholderiaceae bacterium]